MDTIRFLHCSDTHLGKIHKKMRTDEETQRNLMSLDTENQFNKIIDKAIEERVDFVIHSGDMFDRINVKNIDIEGALKCLRRLSSEKIPFVTIAGNHDRAYTRGVVSPLNFINYIPHCTAISQSATKSYNIKGVEVGVHGISYIRSEADERYPEALHSLISNNKKQYNILVSHQVINGSRTGYEISSSNEPEIPATFFPPDLNYVAMGHIHKKQTINHPSYPEMKIHYPGSPLIVDFGERNEKKSISIINITNKEVEINEIELSTRKFEEIAVKIDNPSSTEAEEIIKSKIQSKIDDQKYLGVRLFGGLQIALRKYVGITNYKELAKEFAGFDIYLEKDNFTWFDQTGSTIESDGKWLHTPIDELQTAINDQEKLNKKQREKLFDFGKEIIKKQYGERV
ncbi:MAG: DNA double-strand break repair protein Mre11 [Candidatus Heimdallarchaeota archaeon LC_2]|nr:MAG: DNA double-strand break repair protein Mre11 [Candidatus Heimdallarchaeota archaeon LC_2]